ncbi:hypothetical protein AG1IA_04376 [Rhizoctonia solani AG-1 IA]|uniref:Uncharacterized protein n=1 Tax=Thanatephorus cucumeris (strain AG1-IA) TaxID=983506 RepID=L8WYZ1_THACA|nr:hypothetical protein AG1IA_04376 [Rhizoctonia solani AG-1 IA]
MRIMAQSTQVARPSQPDPCPNRLVSTSTTNNIGWRVLSSNGLTQVLVESRSGTLEFRSVWCDRACQADFSLPIHTCLFESLIASEASTNMHVR